MSIRTMATVRVSQSLAAKSVFVIYHLKTFSVARARTQNATVLAIAMN
jgi:hypothetical protein